MQSEPKGKADSGQLFVGSKLQETSDRQTNAGKAATKPRIVSEEAGAASSSSLFSGGAFLNLDDIHKRAEEAAAKGLHGKAMLVDPKPLDDKKNLFKLPVMTGEGEMDTKQKAPLSSLSRPRATSPLQPKQANLRSPAKTQKEEEREKGDKQKKEKREKGAAAAGGENALNHQTIQCEDLTWQFVGKQSFVLETPTVREEILALERSYAMAMETVLSAGERGAGEKGNGSGAPGQSKANNVASKQPTAFDEDLHNFQGKVHQRYSSLSDALKKRIAQAMYEHKWTDLTLGELQNELLVSCLEQGRLVRRLRQGYAQMFGGMQGLVEGLVGELLEARGRVKELEKERERGEKDKEKEREERRKEHEGHVSSLKAEWEKQKADYLKAEKDYNEQLESMSETLKTMNGVFRSISEDSDKLRAADLRDAYAKLQKILEEKELELLQLRPKKDEALVLASLLSQREKELKEVQERLQNTSSELEQEKALAQSLLQKVNEFDAAEEVKAKERGIENTTGAEGTGEENEEKSEKEKEEQEKAAAAIIESTGSSTPIICVRCKKALDALGNVVEDLVRKKKTTQCLHYRLLLPNLAGTKPLKSTAWTLGCMRAILHSKMFLDAPQVSGVHTQSAPSVLVRFPEYVYGFFSPSNEQIQHLDVQEQMQKERKADELRWSLYYGVKLLAQHNAEARVFYTLLDETYGEDDAFFYSYCLNVLRSIAGPNMNWGSGQYYENYEKYEEERSSSLSLLALPSGAVEPENLWIRMTYTLAATETILPKANPQEKAGITGLLQEMAMELRQVLGRVPPEQLALGPKDNPQTLFVDVHDWMKLVLHEYRQEQARRKAAVRLMFSTAGSGILLSDSAGERSDDRLNNQIKLDPNAAMDMAQFRAMVRTLNRDATPTMVADLFRTTYEFGEGVVNYGAFMKAVQFRQFFSSCLRLPYHYGTGDSYELGGVHVARLGSIVNKNFTLFNSAIISMINDLPVDVRIQANKLYVELVKELGRSSNEEGGAKAVDIDGRRPLSLYRRLLTFLLHFQLSGREQKGRGGGEGFPRARTPHGLLRMIECELEGLQDAVKPAFNSTRGEKRPDEFERLRRIKRAVAVRRIQHVLRQRAVILNLSPLPLSMRMLLSKAYARNVNRIRERKVLKPLSWVRAAMADVYYYCLEVAQEADKHIHDLFFNLRHHSHSGGNVRISTFLALSGLGSTEEEKLLATSEALEFYLLTLRLLHEDEEGRPPSLLFPRDGLKILEDGKSFVSCAKAMNLALKISQQSSETEKAGLKAKISKCVVIETAGSAEEVVDTDVFLLALLEFWQSQLLKREARLTSLLSASVTFSLVGDLISYRAVREMVRDIVVNVVDAQVTEGYQMAIAQYLESHASTARPPSLGDLVHIMRKHLRKAIMSDLYCSERSLPPLPLDRVWHEMNVLRDVWNDYEMLVPAWLSRISVMMAAEAVEEEKAATLVATNRAQELPGGSKPKTALELVEASAAREAVAETIASAKKIFGKVSQGIGDGLAVITKSEESLKEARGKIWKNRADFYAAEHSLYHRCREKLPMGLIWQELQQLLDTLHQVSLSVKKPLPIT